MEGTIGLLKAKSTLKPSWPHGPCRMAVLPMYGCIPAATMKPSTEYKNLKFKNWNLIFRVYIHGIWIGRCQQSEFEYIKLFLARLRSSGLTSISLASARAAATHACPFRLGRWSAEFSTKEFILLNLMHVSNPLRLPAGFILQSCIRKGKGTDR